MKFSLTSATLLLVFKLTTEQQCRYVIEPDCSSSDDASVVQNGGFFGRSTKGEKGERGYSGKLGPKGIDGAGGPKGEMGQKGMKGDPSGSVEELIRRVNELQSNLTQLMEFVRSLNSPTNPSPTENTNAGQLQMELPLPKTQQAPIVNGWTIFQKRSNGTVDFQRNWSDYKNGFGNLATEFWIGLERVHQATNANSCRLRIDLWDFDNDHAYAEYRDFFIENEASMYRLRVGAYSGTAGDCLTSSHPSNNFPFTTIDRDNDRHPSANCAANSSTHRRAGGWWFNYCSWCILNAEWGRSSTDWRNIFWYPWKGSNEKLKATEMKYRCD